MDINTILEQHLDEKNLQKLLAIPCSAVHKFVAEAIERCNPVSVFVCDDSETDITYIREESIKQGEETPLALAGQTIHYDGPNDQARASVPRISAELEFSLDIAVRSGGVKCQLLIELAGWGNNPFAVLFPAT